MPADDVTLGPDFRAPVRQVVPIYGSRASGAARRASETGSRTAETGIRASGAVLLDRQTHLGQNLSSNAYFSMSCGVVSADRRGGLVTMELEGGDCWYLNGLRGTVSGVGLPGFGGVLAAPLHMERLTPRGARFTVASAGPDGDAGAGGMVRFNNGGYRLVPMAETVRVLNTETGRPDGGNVVLAPNLVPFAAGDALEQFHWHLALTGSAGEQVQTQYTPEIDVPTNTTGVVFGNGGGAVVGPGKIAFRCSNAEADAKLLGYGERMSRRGCACGRMVRFAMCSTRSG